MRENTVNIDQVLIDFAASKTKKDVPNKLSFSEDHVKAGKFKKFAFDVYKVDNDPYESLWLLQEFEDGPHLVRANDLSVKQKEQGPWIAISDSNRENVSLSYKNVPIARFSGKEFGFKPEDVFTFKSALLDRVKTDEEFTKNLIQNQPTGKKDALVSTFPEFKKFI